MDFKELKQHVKELMAAMGRTGIKRLSVKHKDLEIQLERPDPAVPSAAIELPAPLPSSSRPLPSMAMPVEKKEKEALQREEVNDKSITSPMVGTFYAASAPESPPFVKVGDVVSKDTVVCIIEAMKVMNEVKAGLAGTVTEVLMSGGDPVEFGTKLFRIRP